MRVWTAESGSPETAVSSPVSCAQRFAPAQDDDDNATRLVARPVAGMSIRIRALSPSGELVPNAYIGIVSDWRRENRPWVERVAEDGSAVFDLPEKSYRIVAGGRGYGVAETVLSISAKTGKVFDVRLAPLKAIEGEVSDERGNPIAGVRIANLNGAIAPPLGMLSELAVHHLSREWSTVTDERGVWRLRIPDATVPLIFEAPGYAAQCVNYRPSDPKSLDVVLSRGGALRVTIDRSDPEMFVTLARSGSDSPSTIPVGLQRQIWARWARSSRASSVGSGVRAGPKSLEVIVPPAPEIPPLRFAQGRDDRPGEATTLAWDSLPPGQYTVYAKYPDPLHFMQKAVQIAAFNVAAGGSQDLRVDLPPLVPRAKKSAAMFLKGIHVSDLGDELAAFARGPNGLVQRIDQVAEDVVGGTVLHLRAEGVTGPFYAVTPDRFVSSGSYPNEEHDGTDSAPSAGILLPRANPSLRLRSAEKDLPLSPAEALLAVFRDCAHAPDKRITVAMDMRKDGLVLLNAPAGCRSAVLSFQTFEPVVLEKPFSPGDQYLGDFLLRAGATADVHVTRDPSGSLVSGATVRVGAVSHERPDHAVAVVAEAVTGDDGWAHLTGLPVLRDLEVGAETTDGQKSVAASLRLSPHDHALIDPLAVPEPATLVLDAGVSEAVRARFPSARVEVVFIEMDDPSRRAPEERQQNVEQDSRPVRFDQLFPGRWRIRGIVKVARTHAMLDADDVVLKAGETRSVSAIFDPPVFSGRVTAAGKGIAARMTFRDPMSKVLEMTDSAGDGTFHLVLPKRGTYHLDLVRLPSQDDIIPIGDVDLTDPARPVEITLPRSRITVHVHGDGRPVARIEVRLRLPHDGVAGVETDERVQISDSSGDVTFEAVAPGVAIVAVRESQGGRAAQRVVAVEEGKDVDVRLDVGPVTSITGVVRDAGGRPVSEALLDCLVPLEAGAVHAVSTSTDSEGKFSIDLDGPVPSGALCSLIAPFGTVDAFKADPGEPVSLTLPASTGSLRITDWGSHSIPGIFWLAAPDGRVISLSAVAARIGRPGATLTIPGLAAGKWRLVRINSLQQRLSLASGLAGSLPTGADVVIDPGVTRTILLASVSQ
jgi:hypothetical protein